MTKCLNLVSFLCLISRLGFDSESLVVFDLRLGHFDGFVCERRWLLSLFILGGSWMRSCVLSMFCHALFRMVDGRSF